MFKLLFDAFRAIKEDRVLGGRMQSTALSERHLRDQDAALDQPSLFPQNLLIRSLSRTPLRTAAPFPSSAFAWLC